MIPLSTLRARLAKLEAARPSTTRKFIVCAGLEEEVDRARIAALEAAGAAVVVILSGVPHAELRPPVVHEETPDGRWVVVDEQDLAA
jgi:hypothetical protein